MNDFPKLFEDHYAYLLQEVLESIDDAVLVFTTDLAVTYANPAAEEVFGARSGKLVGKSIKSLIPIDKVATFETIITTLNASKGHEIQLQGKEEFVGIRANAHFVAEGKLAKFTREQAYILVLRDVTWRKTIEDELETALSHLRKVGATVVKRVEHPSIMDKFPLD